MTKTANLELRKPSNTDYVEVADLNANADLLDAAIGKLSDLETTQKDNLVQAINEANTHSATIATPNVAGIVKPSADFDIAADGTLSIYTAMAITSLSLNKASVQEIGTSVTGFDAAWVLNKTPTEQTITVTGAGDATIIADVNARSTTALTGDAADAWNEIKAKTKSSGTLAVSIHVKDTRDAEETKTASIQWLNGVYTGAAAAPATIDSAFIRTLTKSLQSGKGKTFTVNAVTGAYIWYACPVRYGTPAFNVGGFDGGFSKVATVEYTNPSNYTESYHVWRSDNSGLGSTTVKVS
jgi:hypothetical protein|nr:MAG TPA_asm: hypothetical protein [Caudoviricetes sp.]